MNKVNKLQKEFFLALGGIQEGVVLEYLKKSVTMDGMEEFLYEVTLETICGIMALLDGYERKSVQLDIIDKLSGTSLRAGIELHDACIDYLKPAQ